MSFINGINRLWRIRAGIVIGALFIMASLVPASAGTCGFTAWLEVVEVSTNVTKTGYVPLIPDYENPTIYKHKRVEVTKSMVSSKLCTECHNIPPYVAVQVEEQGSFHTVDETEFVNFSSILTNLIASGSLMHKDHEVLVDGTVSVDIDCSANRTGLTNWSSSCSYPSVAATTLAIASLTASHSLVTMTNYFGSSTTNLDGSLRGWETNIFSDSTEITLSDAYSLSNFVGSAGGILNSPSWPDWTNATDTGWAEYGGVNVVTGQSGGPGAFNCTLSTIKYRIAYCGPKGERGKIEWVERTIRHATGTNYLVSELKKSKDVTCTGNLQYVDTGGTVVAPPSTPGRIEVELLTGTGKCDMCVPGEGDVENGCVRVKMNLGKVARGDTAGFLYIQQLTATAGLGTSATLNAFARPGVQVLKSNSVIRQVVAPQAFVDVVTINGSKYEVRFYSAHGSLGTNGYYQPAGSPFKTWTIETTDQAGEQVKISQSGTGNSAVHEFAWSANLNGWILSFPGGSRRDKRGDAINGTDRTETYLITDANDQPVYKEVRLWRDLQDGLDELLVQETVGPDNNPLTTQWEYYDDQAADGAYYRKLKQVVQPSGGWERYEYDVWGRPSKTVAGFLNASVGASDSLCRVTEYDYTSLVTGDDLTIESETPRREIVKLLGHEISRSYRIYQPGESVEIKCQTPGAAWDASDNIVTTNKTYSNGGFDGWMESSTHPDGTMEIFVYPTQFDGTSVTNTAYSGVPDSNGTSIVDGTKVLTVVNASGEVISSTGLDIASGLVVSYEANSGFDAYGRPTIVTYLDGTSTTTSYGCCGVESETDRDGSVTTYMYDALKRPMVVTRNGIATINVYDAAGNVLQTIRQGTDNSQIVTSQSAYDLAGRLLTSQDALTSTTTYAESGGGLVRTTTLPNSGTRVETYAKDGSLLTETGTAIFPSRHEQGVESVGGVYRRYNNTINLDASGNDTSEWVKTYTDMLGNTVETLYSDGAISQSYYDSIGRLVKVVDPDGVTTLYAYNAKGETEYSALDGNANGQIDLAGSDIITRTVTDVVVAHGTVVYRTRSYVWPDSLVNTNELAGTTESSVSGSSSWQTVHGITSSSVTEHLAGGKRHVTTTAPDGSTSETLYQYGRLVSVTSKDANGEQISRVQYAYDAHGRQKSVTDASTGPTTFTYDIADQVVSVTTPQPAQGQAAQTTVNEYDNMGQVKRTVLPDNTSVTNLYLINGLLQRTFGSRTYPVDYTYDDQGRIKTMKTWQAFAGNTGVAVTTWNYDTNRAFLISKRYDDNHGPDYTYSASGRLLTRTWARGTIMTNMYGPWGTLNSVTYSDGTPPTTFDYNRRGQLVKLAAGTSTDEIQYNYGSNGRVSTETHSAGVLIGFGLTNTYDGYLRHASQGVTFSGSEMSSTTTRYGYDAASRLRMVSNGVYSVGFSYVANSSRLQDTLFRRSGKAMMQTSRVYDRLNRLTQIGSLSAGGTPLTYSYQYNNANQRTRVTHADGSYWVYEYDELGQVKSGKKSWANNTKVAGQQYEYTFDDIGNRTSTKAGGDASGANLRAVTYSANSLNQFTSRNVPGAVDITGLAQPSATVTVNGQSTYRYGGYFRKEMSLDNSSSAVYQQINTIASTNTTIVASNAGTVFLPSATESFSHDLDGNLLTDGRWSFTWDGENRLKQIESRSDAPAGSERRVEFAYDAMSRRIEKKAYVKSGGSWALHSNLRYIYDGWNLLAEVDGNNNLVRSYAWGINLSGTRQAEGGVGGLLTMTVHQGTEAGTYNYIYDGNGNVTALIDSTNGLIVAQYEYGPFGEVIRATGPIANVNPFRFSTKYQDEETGHLYFGYRYYDSGTGSWLSRDPIHELGGDNLYACVGNNLVDSYDPLGLAADLQGHHIVSQKFWEAYKGSPAYTVFDDVKNRIAHPSYKFHDFGTRGGVSHFKYNQLIGDELGKYLKENRLRHAGQMTKEMAEEFARTISKFPKGTGIGAFNAGVRAEMQLAKLLASGKLSKQAAMSAMKRALQKGASTRAVSRAAIEYMTPSLAKAALRELGLFAGGWVAAALMSMADPTELGGLERSTQVRTDNEIEFVGRVGGCQCAYIEYKVETVGQFTHDVDDPRNDSFDPEESNSIGASSFLQVFQLTSGSYCPGEAKRLGNPSRRRILQ